MKPIAIILAVATFAANACVAGMPFARPGDPVASQQETAPDGPVEIPIYDGSVVLSISRGEDLPCIGIRFSDKNINRQSGTYLEIKGGENCYLVKIRYEPREFATIDEAIEVYLEGLIKRFYERNGEEYGDFIWEAFVGEGGLQKFIDTAKQWIDDEFLDSPFNETYG
ncbi:MAG: hypothetical protein LIO77_00235 [Rikenellaceae bacterium]|nr:hypothetical protein [Rikenellaceae bacterium]